MSNKPSKLVRLVQGTVFTAVLCFLSFGAQAASNCFLYQDQALNFCGIQNGGVQNCSVTVESTITSACGASADLGWYQVSNDFYRWNNGYPFFDPARTDPEDYDEDMCIVGLSGTYCPDDPEWYDSDGYDGEGCADGLCPGDPGWYDAEGYDADGFDSSGEDRGGNTAEEGGGYFGVAGTGGTPPHYIETPYPVDPQNGNNRDASNILRCAQAYPVTVTKSLLPSSVQDGLAGCSNECAYQPQSTIWDFATAQEVVQLVPTGYACASEPPISVVDILTYTAPPIGEEPPQEFHNLNACYLNGGYFYCDHPFDPDPAECYRNVGGWLGTAINCQDAENNPETCGYANGVYHCVDSNSNCQSFNGTIHCIDTEGNYIAFNDPDHIINGGNGDGDSTNDVYADSADVDANGRQRVTQVLDAKEVAREIDNRLADNFAELTAAIQSQDLSELLEGSSGESSSDATGFIGSIGDVGTSSELSFDGSIIDPITNIVGGIIPASGSCQTFSYDFLPSKGYTLDINTCNVSIVQPLLQWVVYALTLLSLYNLAIGNKGESS